ncbi:hypothetical protein BJX70DRAFT_382915 [Aspergillus crustosus]
MNHNVNEIKSVAGSGNEITRYLPYVSRGQVLPLFFSVEICLSSCALSHLLPHSNGSPCVTDLRLRPIQVLTDLVLHVFIQYHISCISTSLHMNFRIRGPSGQFSVTLSEDATIEDLRNEIVNMTGLTAYDVNYGYPPLPLSLDHAEGHQKLAELGVKLHREQLTIAPRDGPGPEPNARKEDASNTTPSSSPKVSLSPKKEPAGSAPDDLELLSPEHGGTFIVRVMPDDNSCLFRAVNTAVLGGEDAMVELRSIVAEEIQKNPGQWSAAILGKPRNDYCRWIKNESSWGGGIELEILSRHFDIEICAIDLSNLQLYKFNEGQSNRRCVLVYSGVHYDTIALAAGKNASPEFDEKVFDASDTLVIQKSKALCKLLQEKAPDYNVNPSTFRLRCNICGCIVVGETGAQDHGAQTGHYDFDQTTS